MDAQARQRAPRVRTWEPVEITLEAARDYANPYTAVEVWVRLTGPGFDQRVWGFWDGGRVFKVRVLATAPGEWQWRSEASVADSGLAGQHGTFTAQEWTEAEKQANPNRRGTIRATDSGHAWQYADGTPFFLLADTWWPAATWRIPFKGGAVPPEYVPAEHNWSFEGGVQWLKRLGFNSIGLIAAHPNWRADGAPVTLRDDAGVLIRAAKPKSGTQTSRDMHDEHGTMPFAFPGRCQGQQDLCADFDRLVPAYFQSLDRKMDYLQANGFVPYFETFRRDQSPVWQAYHAWPESFARFLNYLQARYGAHNLIFSLCHFDTDRLSIPATAWREAMNYWFTRYGGMPFGQATTTMGYTSTYEVFGHVAECPWLQLHAVGNHPKDHRMELKLAEAVQVQPFLPGMCNEPYYVNFNAPNNTVGGEIPPPNSDRDTYFARAHAYGHVLNGGLAGHVVGTGSRWGQAVGEPADPIYPPAWETLHYPFMRQARLLPAFLLSEATVYRNLLVASDDLPQRQAPGSRDDSLEGWAHLMRTPDRRAALLYCERQAVPQTVRGALAGEAYRGRWYDPRSGAWLDMSTLRADAGGVLTLPPFPGSSGGPAADDWAATLVSTPDATPDATPASTPGA